MTSVMTAPIHMIAFVEPGTEVGGGIGVGVGVREAAAANEGESRKAAPEIEPRIARRTPTVRMKSG